MKQGRPTKEDVMRWAIEQWHDRKENFFKKNNKSIKNKLKLFMKRAKDKINYAETRWSISFFNIDSIIFKNPMPRTGGTTLTFRRYEVPKTTKGDNV